MDEAPELGTASELAGAESSCDALQQQLEEIERTIGMLDDLPKKRSHAIMMPLGAAAFSPGRLVHTNEVLTDVGNPSPPLSLKQHGPNL